MDDFGNFEIKTDIDMLNLDLESLVTEMNITENNPTAMEDADIYDNDLDQMLSTLEEAITDQQAEIKSNITKTTNQSLQKRDRRRNEKFKSFLSVQATKKSTKWGEGCKNPCR
jgi:c-di-GMP-related signal transduction protein